MEQSRTVQVMQMLLGIGLLVGALLFARMVQVSIPKPVSGPDAYRVASIYKQRMQMTRNLLLTDRLDMATRH